MKLKPEELSLIRAISLIDGAHGQYLMSMKDDVFKPWSEETKNQHFWESLVWINDSLRGYYLGYDWDRDGYILEWRGNIPYKENGENKSHYQKIHVITYTGNGYLMDAVSAIYRALKNHRKEIDGLAE